MRFGGVYHPRFLIRSVLRLGGCSPVLLLVSLPVETLLDRRQGAESEELYFADGESDKFWGDSEDIAGQETFRLAGVSVSR